MSFLLSIVEHEMMVSLMLRVYGSSFEIGSDFMTFSSFISYYNILPAVIIMIDFFLDLTKIR